MEVVFQHQKAIRFSISRWRTCNQINFSRPPKAPAYSVSKTSREVNKNQSQQVQYNKCNKCNNVTSSSKLSRFLSASYTERVCIVEKPGMLTVSENDGKLKILRFVSRALSKAETRNHRVS